MQREIKSGTGIRRIIFGRSEISVFSSSLNSTTTLERALSVKASELPCFFGLQYDVNPPRMVRHRWDASIEDFGSHVLPAK